MGNRSSSATEEVARPTHREMVDRAYTLITTMGQFLDYVDFSHVGLEEAVGDWLRDFAQLDPSDPR